jgi:hypothetical protein
VKVVVKLSKEELEFAAYAGVNRHIRALQRQRKPRQDNIPEHHQNWWQSDIIGVIGEFAVSKAFGVEWLDLPDDPNGKDVLDYQVRATENPKAGLRVRVRDTNTDTFILALCKRNKVLIHGYSTGTIVKSTGNQEFDGCWTLDNKSLYSVTDLAHPIEWSDTVTPYT